MRQYIAAVFLLAMDQVTRFSNMHSIWYVVNYDQNEYRLLLIIGNVLYIPTLLYIENKYQKLYGRRLWFTIFFVLMMASSTSTLIDRIIFRGGRDFIPFDNYVFNLGDIYFALSFICLTVELITNKRGSLKDFVKN